MTSSELPAAPLRFTVTWPWPDSKQKRIRICLMLLMTSESIWNSRDYHQSNPHLPLSKRKQTHLPTQHHPATKVDGVLPLSRVYVMTDIGSGTASILLSPNTHKNDAQIQQNMPRWTNQSHRRFASVFRELNKLRLVLVAMVSSRGVRSIKDCLSRTFLHLLLVCPSSNQSLSQSTPDMNWPIASYGIVVPTLI